MLERDALLVRRVDAADFERPDPPDFDFDPDALAELLPALLRGEADLLVAILKTSPFEGSLLSYPFVGGVTPFGGYCDPSVHALRAG